LSRLRRPFKPDCGAGGGVPNVVDLPNVVEETSFVVKC
jgi:hypothetical protein